MSPSSDSVTSLFVLWLNIDLPDTFVRCLETLTKDGPGRRRNNQVPLTRLFPPTPPSHFYKIKPE